jgi:hypothetical protein
MALASVPRIEERKVVVEAGELPEPDATLIR